MIHLIGKFELLRPLGRGGMGTVFLGRDPVLGREVAIKTISMGAEGDQAELRQRFLREASLAAKFSHPNLLTIYEFGEQDGILFIAMEFLRGVDLNVLLERRLLGPRVLLELLAQVADGLQEAHLSGVIHRDIKPGNIILCQLGLRGDFTKVVDFGLVTPTRATEADPLIADADFVMGTPAYMAPEVAAGRPGDERSDLYSLGCVAYWLLTGRSFFDDRSEGRTSLAPSAHSPHHVPPVVDDLVLACVSEDPTGRPASAQELARWLEVAERACLPWTPERARAWWAGIETTSAAEAHRELQELSWLHRGRGAPGAETTPLHDSTRRSQ